MKRLVAAITLVVVVVLVVGAALVVTRDSSGDDAGPTPVAPSGGPPADRPTSPDLTGFYSQRLDWSACTGSASEGDQCARLSVPLDYRRASGPTIEISVLKVPASGSRIGSLMVNPGGPGAPGTSFAAGRGTWFGEPLLQHFDIVGFDPRGTGDSSPVDCLSDPAMNRYLSGNPTPTTRAEIATYHRLQARLVRGCSVRSGELAAHVSTVEAARDMDILRSALGERTMSYLGASYGTKLGATYAQLFPQRVGRFVLDGAIDPELGTRATSVQQAKGFQTALDAYAANCVQESIGCFLGKDVDGVEHTISSLLDTIADHPLPAGDRTLTAGSAYYGISAALYNREYWIVLSAGLRGALNGDGSLLMQLADAYADRNADGSFNSNLLEAFTDISCLDAHYSIPYSKVPRQFAAFDKASPVFGRTFAWSLTMCDGFKPRSDEPVPTIRAAGAAPIVVIGTTRDPATPYPWAVALARQLQSGVLISRAGDGHTGYHHGNPCVDRAVESYLVSGVVPRDGLSC